jgi:hypothetical protein
MAAPHVVGVAVLSLEAHPFILPVIEVKVLKAATTTNVGNILRRSTPKLLLYAPKP